MEREGSDRRADLPKVAQLLGDRAQARLSQVTLAGIDYLPVSSIDEQRRNVPVGNREGRSAGRGHMQTASWRALPRGCR